MLSSVCFGITFVAVACQSQSQQLTSAEQEALAKLDAEPELAPAPTPVIPSTPPKRERAPRRKPALVQGQSQAGSPIAGSSECYEFNFYNQRRILLNRDPSVICKGDGDRQVFLRSPQGRIAILNLSSEAIFDPVGAIDYVSDRQLLCFDHNFPPNALRPWLNGAPTVNCCSDIYFEKSESGKAGTTVTGRVDGPPSNCGQD